MVDTPVFQAQENTPKVNIDVYSYGGCTSCGGNTMWNWLYKQNLNINHVNVQVQYERQAATERAIALGVAQKDVYFPLFFVGGKVVVGFKPGELANLISEERNNV